MAGPRRPGLALRAGAPVGDTSILGWVVMGLKSAKEIGTAIPDEAWVRRGTLLWLERVATGDDKGLARYQPAGAGHAHDDRRGLGLPPVPGRRRSRRLRAPRRPRTCCKHESDRGESNVYYWYYAHAGPVSARRPTLVALERPASRQDRRAATTSGHQTGSWDPDDSLYGSKGGRIYCTTLAALSLEVYYRYLRLYDEPKIRPTPRSADEAGPALEACLHDREPPDRRSDPVALECD